MSMKADLLNPELGYYDEGLNLTSIETYSEVIKDFGKAKRLNSIAYSSRVFMELENEKIWTRGWIPIGLSQQIPNICDLLPFTLGFHGVHAQRMYDNSIDVRLNFHQHGGCRFVPEQCRTGAQTKCSIHSCNYTRDSDVIFGENDNNSDLMYKFVGINPHKLRSVSFDILSSIILVNLDPSYKAFEKSFDDEIISNFQKIKEYECIYKHKWIDCESNWKIFFYEFMNYFKDFSFHSEFKHFNENSNFEPYFRKKINISKDFLKFGDNAEIFWLFPNFIFFKTQNFCFIIILQATAMNKNLQRCFFLTDKSIDKNNSDQIFDDFVNLIKKINAKSKINHQTRIQSKTSHDFYDVEENKEMYHFNKHIVDKVLKEHTYYRNPPIMDAGFQGLKRM